MLQIQLYRQVQISNCTTIWLHISNTLQGSRPQFQQNSATLQLALQSWLMKAAGPSHNCAQFLRQLYITEKSFFPGCNSMASSSSLSSAIQPTRQDIFSFLYLQGKKTSCKNCMWQHKDAQIFTKDGAKWMLSGPKNFSKFKKQPHHFYSHRGCTFHSWKIGVKPIQEKIKFSSEHCKFMSHNLIL